MYKFEFEPKPHRTKPKLNLCHNAQPQIQFPNHQPPSHQHQHLVLRAEQCFK